MMRTREAKGILAAAVEIFQQWETAVLLNSRMIKPPMGYCTLRGQSSKDLNHTGTYSEQDNQDA